MANNVGQFCRGAWVNDEDDICLVNVFWLKEIKQINAEVTEMWSENVALKLCYVVAPSKHLPAQHSNSMNDERQVGFGSGHRKMICLIRGSNELDVVPIVGMGAQGKTIIARKV
ncbi:hypothetical protein HAX54_050250 [Datura stramonium]|uniref:Uncharacterized protein n=1 Tax=Datura stramonium TaxID=4076 RepID=A0ABS8WQY0_DATST|nr:hypothetical protein [Datura stramonium]